MQASLPEPGFSRRRLLKTSACGFGYLAFAGLSGLASRARASDTYANPLASRAPHFHARAKRVIFLFMQGGPSHLDTFDHKPELQRIGTTRENGKPLASPFEFPRAGKSGLPISELFPGIARHADDLCLLNGMHTDTPAHPQATIFAHTGSVNFVRPSMGAWTLYGLGSENESLPGYVTINPPDRLGGAQNHGSAFLPACYQGTPVQLRSRDAIDHIRNSRLAGDLQRRQVDLVQTLNRGLLERLEVQPEVEGIIQSYELAFRMQDSVPDVVDLSSETSQTLERYGIGRGPADAFGRQCLLARRFAEAGVRFIELHHGGWDQHNGLTARLRANAGATDQPIAALLDDLKERGLFDDTLIVWGGEFGRSPDAQGNGDGRRHNNRGYTMWLAGGGVAGGQRHGATDDLGGTAVEGKVHVHDLHATMLHLLGLDHERLTYRYAGRDFRLTDVHGQVVREVLA